MDDERTENRMVLDSEWTDYALETEIRDAEWLAHADDWEDEQWRD